MGIQDYTDSEFKQALERNLRSLTRGKKSSKQPIAILLGGQSGAGKTTIHRIKQKEFQGNIVIIDGDSFRSQHPHYLELQQEYGKDSVEYTKDFARKMVESLVTELSHLGYNLLIEGTLRTIDVPKKTAQLLKSRGYEVQLALIATKPKLSYLSTLIRYEELMIGKNIKSLRKTHDLTQDDFSRIVGISRNSLSRYENGTSSVSTELIDIICQKFNVSYVDIVGEDKMLNPVEDYELTLKIEIVKERGANLLSRLYRYQDSQGISIDDESNPWILMSDDLSDLIHTNIYLVETFDEIERYSGYLDGIERMLEISEKRMVA
ncbi:type II toxin-antitoxin system antitoxin PezA [Streptococcus pneumoniae]|nr:type II toxin-antitoxin system antitoxin PezA [Streptococcus pneumoniae]CEY19970.1 transcriptional regulator [Streptococcus pneumoniae]